MATLSVEDRLAINDLFVRYTTALDECDIERVVGCFTPDCVLVSPIHGSFNGHQGIRDFATPNVRLKARGGQFRHFISNLIIEVQGERAKAYCYLLDFLTIDGKTELLSPGVYDCDLVKQDGQWLFTRRLVNMDYKFSLPPADSPRARKKATGGKATKKAAAKKRKSPTKARRSRSGIRD